MASTKHDYTLDNIIQSNDFTISYRSFDKKTGQTVFIKSVHSNIGDFTDDFKIEHLSNSFKLAKTIKSNLILSPIKLQKIKNNILVVYPYLDSSIWEPLTEKIFLSDCIFFLKQICFILDHLHECNLVHCDIKLSNFMYNKSTRKIILIDLEFITEHQSKCNAIVKGTADYITPDIIKNDIIDNPADYYALAVTLEKLYKKIPSPQNFNRFISRLKDNLNQKSLSSLLEALTENAIIGVEASANYKQSLFALYIFQVKYNLSKFKKQSIKVPLLKRIFSVDNKIVGFSDEILDLLHSKSLVSKRETFNQLQSLILKSKLEKIGEYWICYLPEKELISIISKTYCKYTSKELMREINILQKDMKFLIIYLLMKHTINNNNLQDSKNIFLLTTLAESCIALNKTVEALAAFEQLLPLETSENQLTILYEITVLNLAMNQDEKALSIINNHLKCSDIETQFKFKSLKDLIEIRNGNYLKAEDSLNSIITQSQKNKFYYTEIIGYYYLSLIFYYRGDYSKAIFYVEIGIEKAKKHKQKNLLTSLQTMGIHYYSRTGDYQPSIIIGKTVLKNIDSFESYGKIVSILNHLFTSYIKTGNYSKAKECLFKSISTNNTLIDENKLILFFINKGLVELHEGKLNKSRATFLFIIRLKNNGIKSNIGSIYQNLVQISLYMNNQSDFTRYFDKAQTNFEYYKDYTSQLQLRFFQVLNEWYNLKQPKQPDKLWQIYLELKELNEGYYSSMVLFHYLLASLYQRVEINQIKLEKSQNPLIRCTQILLNLFRSSHNNEITTIESLKAIYKELQKNNFVYFAAIVASFIAEQYENNNLKLGIKFYEQSKELYNSIDNSENSLIVIDKISKLRISVDQKSNSHMELVKEISSILQNIENYDESIKRCLQFILDQTSAERAVLLLKKENSSELRVKSYINCDKDCLADIYKFSSSITLESFQTQSSIIIENALLDKRSNQYKSIIAHNIQSIISLPIKRNGKILGVLYLDHQTIPALFTLDDVDFAKLLSNLLAIVLNNLDSFRNISIINQELVAELELKTSHRKFISKNKSINRIFEKLPNIAKTNATILLLGESGTGKEIFTDIIHKLSLRAKKPLIKINCTAFAEDLIESELFGIDKNVATDVKARDGKFTIADNGTIFIDEIGDMPLKVQSKILRAIEYQQFEKVGSNRTIRTDIRFIYATNKDLLQLVKEGKFREDLYHRINTIPITIPPLRDRKDDIPLLVEHFIKMYTINNNPPILSTEILSFFENYNWPGNVRELKNVIGRLCIMQQGEMVFMSHLPNNLVDSLKNINISSIKELAEKHHIIEALRLHKNVESRAAKSIGMSLSTFRRKINKYNLKNPI